MSSQPGKDEARSDAGRTGKGSGSGDSPAGGKPKKSKKTVAASAAKPGRDEATVEIPPAEETKADLPRIEPEPSGEAAGRDQPEITPVRDTPGAPPAASDSSSEPSWTKPAEPAASVSSGRAEPSFGAPEPPADHSAPPVPGVMNPGGPSPQAGTGHTGTPGSGGTSRFGSGFAGSVLKNRGRGTSPGSAKPGGGGGKTARKAQLQLARLEPWSVMKFSFVMSLVCFVVLLVAVIVLYAILSGLGVFSAITDTVSDLTRRQGETSGGLDAGSWFSFARVFGYTVLVGALNVLLITALSTVGSVIYNLAADLVGGVEVTLKEAE
ncbi:DUF3566 domain-containing protein [Actinomadura rugatobispora]|uniref:DUF3566 domain-containing protein n=1 Tax=Actinomadura rugatobispora TaxID=1994 RepID=A0ABW0ZTA4_9ACTN|nr:DUF3566 domain-containing protein [Actinomadura rugatobispora]